MAMTPDTIRSTVQELLELEKEVKRLISAHQLDLARVSVRIYKLALAVSKDGQAQGQGA